MLFECARSAILVFYRNRDDLAAEASFCCRAGSPAMTREAELVEFVPADLPLLCHQISADALVNQPIIIAFQHLATKGLSRTLLVRRPHRYTRHHLNAARDRYIVCATEYTLRCKMNSLLT